jgi:hypothetical protein
MHSAQIADLQNAMQQNHAGLSGALEALAQRFADKYRQQDALVASNHEQLSSQCAKLEGALKDEATWLRSRCEEVYNVLDRRIETVAVTAGQHWEHFSELHAKVDKKFTIKNAAQDELLDSHRREVADVCAKLDAKFSADVVWLGERVQSSQQQFAIEMGAHAKAVDEQLQECDTKFTQLYDAQEAQWRQKDADQDEIMSEEFVRIAEVHKSMRGQADEQEETLRELIAENCSSLDCKFTAENAEQHERIEENHKHAVDVLAQLERQLLEQSQSLDDKFTSACSKLEKWAKERVSALEERVDGEHALFLETCRSLQTKFTSGLSDIDRKFSLTCSQVDAKFSDSGKRCESRIEEHYSYFSGVCAGLDTKLEDRIDEVNCINTTRTSELDTMVRQIKSEQEAKMEADYDHFTGMCTQIDSKHVERGSQIEQALGNTIGQIERNAIQKDDELDTRIESVLRQMTQNTERLQRQCDQQGDSLRTMMLSMATEHEQAVQAVDVAFNTRIDQIAQSMDEQDAGLIASISSQDERLSSAISGCASQLQVVQDEMEQKHAYFEQKFTDKAEAQDERSDELSSSILELREHFSAVGVTLDSRISKEVSDLRQAAEAVERRIMKSVQAQIDSAAKELSGDWSAQLDREHQSSTSAVAHLSSKVDEAAQTLEEQLSTNVSRLDKKMAEQNAMLSKRVDKEHTHFQDLCAGLEESISRYQLEANKELHTVEQNLTTRFGDKFVATDARIASTGSHFAEVCTAIERTFNSNLDELDAAFIQAVGKIDGTTADIAKQLLDTSTEASSRLDQLTKDLSAESDRRTGEISELNSTVFSTLSDAESAFGDGLRQLEISTGRKFELVSERTDGLSRAIQTTGTNLGRLAQKLDAQIAETVQLSKDFVDQKLETHGSSIAEKMSSLEQTLDGTVSKADTTEARLSTLEVRSTLAIQDLQADVPELANGLQSLISDVDNLQTKMEDVAANADINALLVEATARSAF